MRNDEAARQSRSANPISRRDDSTRFGERCPDCGKRSPTLEQVLRHRVRRCCGYIAPWRPWDEPRVAA